MNVTEVLDVRYIGRCRVRRGTERCAVGWLDGTWRVIFPEPVLKRWFGVDPEPTEEATLYGALGIKQTPDEKLLRSAYRRMVRQWHPDVCKELGASEQFMRVQQAYDILKETNTRARYDAGLALTAKINLAKVTQHTPSPYGYRSPLRCGMILASGRHGGKWFVVDEIMLWEDISASDGRVLVTSWPIGADEPWEVWR